MDTVFYFIYRILFMHMKMNWGKLRILPSVVSRMPKILGGTHKIAASGAPVNGMGLEHPAGTRSAESGGA